MAKDEVSPHMKRMLEKGRAEARKRVIERGLVQFRADPDTMRQMLEISEHRGVPLGTMLREWVKDRLRYEQAKKEESGTSPYEALCMEVRDKLGELRDLLVKERHMPL